MMTADRRNFDVVLVLSGGNVPGTFETGVYEALHDNGLAWSRSNSGKKVLN